MTFWETVERGEYIMIALAVLFIITVCIWWIRGSRLMKEKNTYPLLMYRIKDYMSEGDVDNARQICQAVSSPGAKIMNAGLEKIGSPLSEISAAMEGIGRFEKEEMGAGIQWLKVIAVVSPLLGLGGTLLGVIDRLRDLGEMGGMVDLSMLCSEIAPTIVTTVAGLGVGIFSLIASTWLDAVIENSKVTIDKISYDFLELLNQPS